MQTINSTPVSKPSSLFSDIRIKLLNESADKAKALASCTIAGAVAVTGFKVVEGKYGLFVSMPSRKGLDGEYRDVAFPVSKEMREELQKAIIDAFERLAHGYTAPAPSAATA